MHIEELPDDVLELIFDYVEPWRLRHGVARVSRRWAAVARRRAPSVRSVRGLRLLRRGLRALLVPAGLEGFHTHTLLARVAQLAPRLAALTLHGGVRLGRQHLATVGHLLPHLRHLDVFLQPGLSIPSTLVNLQSLVINHDTVPRCHHLDGKPLRAIHMFGESRYFRALPLLRAHREHLSELTLRCPEMSDRGFEVVGTCCSLEVLQLYSCWLMTGAGWRAVTRPPRLRRLHVTGTVLLRRAVLGEALTTLPRGIEELVLSGSSFSDEHVATLAERLPCLSMFEAWDCKLSAAGALRLAAALPLLRVLDLNRQLSAAHVAAVRRHPRLEFLRCLPEDKTESSLTQSDRGLTETSEPARRELRLESATAQFPGDYFRGDGAGFRGKLFYYWTPPLQLSPAGTRDCCF